MSGKEEERGNIACVSTVVLVPRISHGLHVGGVHQAGVMTEICDPTRLLMCAVAGLHQNRSWRQLSKSVHQLGIGNPRPLEYRSSAFIEAHRIAVILRKVDADDANTRGVVLGMMHGEALLIKSILAL